MFSLGEWTSGTLTLAGLNDPTKPGLSLYRHLQFRPELTPFKHLPTLQPPTLPQSSWISVLIQAVQDLTRYVSTRAEERRSFDSSWAAFISLWIFNYYKPNPLRGDDFEIHLPSDLNSLLQGILISTCLYRWTSRATYPEVDDHNLLSRAMQPDQQESLSQELSSHTQRLGQQYRDLRLCYDIRTTLHILNHLIDTTPPGVDVILHVAHMLFPLRGYIF
ncbi:hypothetical protein BDV98DRAFT_247048 [Pterulicium gracile]|uniref:Uncharacterized protein n=1 Tax=Pterulicium gracile TaxID=1884261 RepID=A0A5C3QHU8_9AGAR|nr:hypothetical protein BDV98DRAFT_247048 [Pterula gracilis]